MWMLVDQLGRGSMCCFVVTVVVGDNCDDIGQLGDHYHYHIVDVDHQAVGIGVVVHPMIGNIGYNLYKMIVAMKSSSWMTMMLSW